MTKATIRIEANGPGSPKGGLVGAFAGGLEPGASQVIEVDLRHVSGGDVAVLLPIVAETWRTAVHGEREASQDGTIPFPEAGDRHPFPDRSIEEKIAGLRDHPTFEITTDEEYDALPLETRMIDRDGDTWAKSNSSYRGVMSYAPLRVIYIPKVEG